MQTNNIYKLNLLLLRKVLLRIIFIIHHNYKITRILFENYVEFKKLLFPFLFHKKILIIYRYDANPLTINK